MKNHITKTLILLCFLLSCQSVFSIERTAKTRNVKEIIKWAKDGLTTKIIFPNGVYNFSESLTIANKNLILEGENKEKTILKLTKRKNALINATGNNIRISNLTLDGDFKQTGFVDSLFKFNKSKGHHFENVKFKNTNRNGINSVTGWATDGLQLINCEFSNIKFFCLQIFNRNTNNRNGQVITTVDKILIDGCTFRTGYKTAISSDNGNDRQNDGTKNSNGKLIGRRYTESTSLSGSTIQNCFFGKSSQFHIALVQTKDLIIQNNKFMGMTDDASKGSQPIHVEQLSRNIEIYDNIFSMAASAPKAYSCIHFRGTEGHVRAEQQQASDTYREWLYYIKGSRERRANTRCARSGHVDKSCKRDVHFYGIKNLYIAGNIFIASPKFSEYLYVNEGENIQIGIKKDGTLSLNDFQDGNGKDRKILFGGNDEGTCNVTIVKGQKITSNDIHTTPVTFDLPACVDTNPIVFISPESLSKEESISKKPIIKKE